MRKKSGPHKATTEQVVKDIRRKTRKVHSAEEKIRIVLEGLRGEESIAALCRREGPKSALRDVLCAVDRGLEWAQKVGSWCQR